MEPRRRIRSDNKERTVAPFNKGPVGRARTRLEAFHLRDVWWHLLNYFEARRSRRIALYCTAALLVTGVVARLTVYPWWAERNAIRVAQMWLSAGQYRNAADAAERASRLAPTRPEPWHIAAELARIGGQHDKALEYARRAAALAPADVALGIGWSAAALNAGDPAEAKSALGQQPPEAVAASPEAQRILGELARRDLQLTAARHYFEAALKLEGPRAVNEVPLGLILLNATNPAERQHGLALLGKWTADREWGLVALRVLLEDALTRNDRAALPRWAEALRAHPGFAVGDMPRYLLALSISDHRRYREVLDGLERDHRHSPQATAQLVSWLNQIGQGAEVARWMLTLPAEGMQRPPLVVAGAEALRQAEYWPWLFAWTDHGDWGTEAEFLRWTYGLLAARKLGNDVRAEEWWRILYNHAQLNGTHGMFAASSLYSWNRKSEAETLWWRVAEREDGLAIEALGSLVRHYQVTRDADGQYRAFRRLHLLQPQNADIGNNFAFFALLLGREQRQASEVAQLNSEQNPGNLNYLATRAFALTQQARYADALRLLQPKASLVPGSPGLGLVYGLALAGTGRKDEARSILSALPADTLTVAETELIARALAN